MIRHFTGMVQTAMAIVSGTVQGARGTHMCVRPPQRRYLCLRPRGDSCRRSRFLKKRSRCHWLAFGGQNSGHHLSKYVPWYVHGCAANPTCTGALYVRAWTVSPTDQRHNDMHCEHSLSHCVSLQASSPARDTPFTSRKKRHVRMFGSTALLVWVKS